MRSILLIFIAFWLSGCAATDSVNAHIIIKSVRYLNPDINGKAAPVELNFYQLKTPYLFKQAHYYSLESNAAVVLQDNLVDKNTLEVRPNQLRVDKLELPLSVHFIGITASFRNIDHASWRLLLHVPKVKPRWYHWWHTYDLTLYVNLFSQAVTAHINQ